MTASSTSSGRRQRARRVIAYCGDPTARGAAPQAGCSSAGSAAEECSWLTARRLRGSSVKAKAARAEGDHVKEPAGHHQVLVEMDHVALISDRQMHAKGQAEQRPIGCRSLRATPSRRADAPVSRSRPRYRARVRERWQNIAPCRPDCATGRCRPRRTGSTSAIVREAAGRLCRSFGGSIQDLDDLDEFDW